MSTPRFKPFPAYKNAPQFATLQHRERPAGELKEIVVRPKAGELKPA